MNMCDSEWEPTLGSGRHRDKLVGAITKKSVS